MNKPIFISHSSKDSEVANRICAALEENGLKCWIAPRDIPYGSAWAGEISKAISEASAFLFLSSGSSNFSDQVIREIELAISNSITIIPIRLDETQYSDTIKYYLATIHCMIEYDTAKTHKLVADIMSMLDFKAENEEGNKAEGKEKTKESKDEKPNKKEKAAKSKKQKKTNYVSKMALCLGGAFLWALIAAVVFVFAPFGAIIKYAAAAVCAALAFIPVFMCRRKAFKNYSVNRTKINLMAVVSAVVFALVLGGGYMLDGYLWRNDKENVSRIILKAPEDMTAADYQKAIEVVEKRIEILMGKEKYSFDIEGEEIKLLLSNSAFGEESVEDVMKAYVTRQMRFYFTVADESLVPDGAPTLVELTSSDIEGLTVKNGTIEGLDRQEHGIETETYDYIELVLTDEYIKSNADAIKAYGESIILAQDKKEHNIYYYNKVYRGENEKTFLICSDSPGTNLTELLLYNLGQEPMSGALSVDIEPVIVWEETQDNSRKGENQCDAKDIGEDGVTVVLEASTYSSSGISEGEMTDTVSILKKRLDAVGQPYSFGTCKDKEDLLAFKISSQYMGAPVIELLISNMLKITGSCTEITVSGYYGYSDPALKLYEDENTVAISVDAEYESDEAKYKSISALAEEKLFLASSASNMPVLSMTADKNTNGKRLVFDEICLGLNKKLDSETKWVAQLIETVYLNKLPLTLRLERYYFDEENDGSEKNFGVRYDNGEIEEKIIAAVPGCEVEFDGESVKVYLNLSVDENLPQAMLEKAEAIFRAVDFESINFNQLMLYMIDEDNETTERCRIFFSKYFKTMYSENPEGHEDGFIYVTGIFSGGRLDRDKEAFMKLVNENEFIAQYNHKADGLSFFD